MNTAIQTPLPSHLVSSLLVAQPSVPVWTIGYRQTGARTVIDTLVLHEGWMRVDIRLSPSSVFLEWTGKACRERYEDHYLHLPELGNVHYHHRDQPIQIANLEVGLSRLTALPVRGRRCLLLCACPDALQCHRHLVAQHLQANGIAVRHFMMSLSLPSHQAEVAWLPSPVPTPCDEGTLLTLLHLSHT